MDVAAAIASGSDVIAAPIGAWYLPQTGYSVATFYEYDPCSSLDADACAKVLGVEAALWGEKVDASDLDSTMFAERAWSANGDVVGAVNGTFANFTEGVKPRAAARRGAERAPRGRGGSARHARERRPDATNDGDGAAFRWLRRRTAPIAARARTSTRRLNDGRTPLLVVAALIAAGARVVEAKKNGMTPLSTAAAGGRREVVSTRLR